MPIERKFGSQSRSSAGGTFSSRSRTGAGGSFSSRIGADKPEQDEPSLPHEEGNLTKRRFEARGSSKTGNSSSSTNSKPPSTVEGYVGGVDHTNGNHIVVRPGGDLLEATSNEVPVLPGQPTQVTVGTPGKGTKLPASQPQRFREGVTSLDGATVVVQSEQNPEILPPCSEGGSSPGSGSVSFNRRDPEDFDDPPAPDDPFPGGGPPEFDTPADNDEDEPPENPTPPVPEPRFWQCRDSGYCIPSTLGTFATQEECAAQCVPISYNCVNGTCVRNTSGGGQFPTLDACLSSLCEGAGYACINGACQETPGGPFATAEDCWASACLTCEEHTVTTKVSVTALTFGQCGTFTIEGNEQVRFLVGTGFSIVAEGESTRCPGVPTSAVVKYTNCAGDPQQVQVGFGADGLQIDSFSVS